MTERNDNAFYEGIAQSKIEMGYDRTRDHSSSPVYEMLYGEYCEGSGKTAKNVRRKDYEREGECSICNRTVVVHYDSTARRH